jgi:hypothetical protein
VRVRDVLRRLGGNCRREQAASKPQASRNPLVAAASSQSAPGKFADHGHTIVRRATSQQKGPANLWNLHGFWRLLHSCTRVASSSASSSRCLFWRAPPWSSVRLLPSLAAGTLDVENSPRQHRSSPSSLKPRPNAAHHRHHVGQAHPVRRSSRPECAFLS